MMDKIRPKTRQLWEKKIRAAEARKRLIERKLKEKS